MRWVPTAVACGTIAACSGKFSTSGVAGPLASDSGATGGATTGVGGASSKGGAKSSGGAHSSGGARSSGGTSSTGGIIGDGGSGGDGGGMGVSDSGGVVIVEAGASGAPGTGGVVGTGGVRASGGTFGTGGVVATGGIRATGGATTGGSAGTGGVATGCIAGTLDCDANQKCGPDGHWQSYTCGPLMASDVVKIDATTLPGFYNVGFRCKSLSVCSVSQTCYYDSNVGTGNLGSVFSTEDLYYDGLALTAPQAVKLQIQVGAASQCLDPPITIVKGEYITVGLANNTAVQIVFPAFNGTQLTLYVREDGATFYDQALTQRAG